jgi:hypothetical protein
VLAPCEDLPLSSTLTSGSYGVSSSELILSPSHSEVRSAPSSPNLPLLVGWVLKWALDTTSVDAAGVLFVG